MSKLWNKNFIALLLTNLFTANCFYILLAVVPLFVVEGLQMSKSHVGLVMGAFSITGVLTRPIAGFLLDNIGRRVIYIVALSLFMLCTVGYIFTATFITLLTLRLMHGVGWGLVSTSGSTVAADVIPPSRRAEGLGYFGMSMSIGMAMGPALGVFMLKYLPFEDVFIYSAIFALASVLFGLSIKMPPFERKAVKFSIKALVEKRVLGLALIFMFYGISYGSVMGFAILYGNQLNVHNSGLFFLIFAIVMIIIRPIVGKRLDRGGVGHSMGFGLLLVMGAIFMLSRATGQTLYFAAAVLLGVGGGIVVPLLTAMTMNVVPANRRGAASATVYTCLDIGIGGGGVLFGRIADLWGISTMYTISCVFLIVPLIFYYARERGYYEANKNI
ncbi:MAG: MFS transporter [Deferribacteraceae bacterium]|nr:MFS transporter [Deferribacteraceae bacterium]